jgi:2-polyprenyl-6-methoxyphenol hydroxylase-like FAD-dependent oxidoreductase
MTQSVAVVGAGIAGMCTALSLAKQGFKVTIFERDIPPPGGDADQAFFEWQRRGAAQFRHPHAFLGLMCSILEEHHPELLQDFFDAGARRMSFEDTVPPHLMDQYKPEPGDEKLWILLCRRATMETVLRRYTERVGNIEIHNATYVTGVQTEHRADGTHVTGLELTDRHNDNQKSHYTADLYIDASGRASKFRRWFEEQGINISEQRNDAEIVYYTRHYKLKPGVQEPSRHENERAAGDLGYMKYGVFPGDGGNFAIIICVPNGETELRTAIKKGENFDAICRNIPGLVPWIAADKAEATTPSFGIGEIHAVWRDFVEDGKPVLLDFFAVGDSSARTNPLYGRGCSVGILHGQILADVLANTQDPTVRALQFAEQTKERIGPIFDASLSEDKNGIKRAEAVMLGQSRDKADSLKKWFGLAFGDALAAAANEKIHVFRGMMRTVNLVEKPGEFLQDGQVKRTIFRYMLRGRKRNAKARVQRGPDRQAMLKQVAALNN